MSSTKESATDTSSGAGKLKNQAAGSETRLKLVFAEASEEL